MFDKIAPKPEIIGFGSRGSATQENSTDLKKNVRNSLPKCSQMAPKLRHKMEVERFGTHVKNITTKK